MKTSRSSCSQQRSNPDTSVCSFSLSTAEVSMGARSGSCCAGSYQLAREENSCCSPRCGGLILSVTIHSEDVNLYILFFLPS